MATKRMFDISIVDSDLFLEMPQSTQNLYFHANMRADDDGFIGNIKKIQKIIGASEDDLKILMLKKFIIPFENGICVIRHWKINNYLRNDRYKSTIYLEERELLVEDKNGAYELKSNIGENAVLSSNTNSGIPVVHQMATQYSIEENSIEENSIEEKSKKDEKLKKQKNEDWFEIFWNKYPKKLSKENARKSFLKINLDDVLFSNILNILNKQKESKDWKKDNGQYIPYPATWLNQKRWQDEMKSEKVEIKTTEVDTEIEKRFKQEAINIYGKRN